MARVNEINTIAAEEEKKNYIAKLVQKSHFKLKFSINTESWLSVKEGKIIE